MELLLFLAGDVMLGRGIDQILKYKNNPMIYESFVKDARYYIPNTMKKFSEQGKYVDQFYVWGDLLNNSLFKKSKLKIINLETSITTSEDKQNKAVLYRMHPNNINVIKDVGIDYCHMANNHVMDWGIGGLYQSIDVLMKNNIQFGGIGWSSNMAKMPKIFEIGNKKIYIFSYGDVDSGIPYSWKATTNGGVNVISTSNLVTMKNVANDINNFASEADFIIVSIHWGSNWGYDIPEYHREFAHYIIENAKVDLIHGHSSHHFRPIEIYQGKLILYGCGDLINDYETIDNGEKDIYLSWASIAYFPKYNLDTRELLDLVLIPCIIRDMKLVNISERELLNIVNRLNKICYKYHCTFIIDNDKIKLSVFRYTRGYSKNYYRKYTKYKNKYLELMYNNPTVLHYKI